jgi:hypothetical protein
MGVHGWSTVGTRFRNHVLLLFIPPPQKISSGDHVFSERHDVQKFFNCTIVHDHTLSAARMLSSTLPRTQKRSSGDHVFSERHDVQNFLNCTIVRDHKLDSV